MNNWNLQYMVQSGFKVFNILNTKFGGIYLFSSNSIAVFTAEGQRGALKTYRKGISFNLLNRRIVLFFEAK